MKKWIAEEIIMFFDPDGSFYKFLPQRVRRAITIWVIQDLAVRRLIRIIDGEATVTF